MEGHTSKSIWATQTLLDMSIRGWGDSELGEYRSGWFWEEPRMGVNRIGIRM